MQRRQTVMVAGITLALLSACGAPEDRAADTSDVHFITFGASVTGLVSKTKQPVISACITGHNSSNREKWAKDIQEVILKWVEPLRSETKAELANQVQVIDGSGRCDVDVVISPSVSPAFTRISSRPSVNMNTSGHYGSYNVLLHEFGHAFALSDTYQGRTSGNCKPGQPQAVMCNVKFSNLQEDDKEGVRSIFKRVFPNDQAGGPNSGGGIVNDTALNATVAVALGRELSQDTFEFAAGISGPEAKPDMNLSYCVGICGAGSVWIPMSYSRSVSGTHIYSVASQEIFDGAEIKIQVNSGLRKKISAVSFKAI